MNSTLKTILLTVLTLSLFTIALIEVSGVSQKALFNKLGMKQHDHPSKTEVTAREDQAQTMEQTVLRAADSTHNFGTIKEGDIVQHDYVIANVGDKPLFIANVKTSCGCTAPSFSKEPIAAGEKGIITLEFNSSGKSGSQKKGALIVSNARNSPYRIGFEAQVK